MYSTYSTCESKDSDCVTEMLVVALWLFSSVEFCGFHKIVCFFYEIHTCIRMLKGKVTIELSSEPSPEI